LKVANVENALHPASKQSLDLSSLKLKAGYPTRPGYGTKGVKVVLTTNFVELLPPSDLALYRYDIQISPEAVGRKRFRVLELLLQSTELAPYSGGLVTDFRSNLVSKTRLVEDATTIEVQYLSDGEDEPAAGAVIYKVHVQYTKTLSVAELIDYLNSTDLSQTSDDKPEVTQALNIFLNHYAKSAANIATIGSTKTFSLQPNAAKGHLGAGLEVIRGFFSSVRVATARILVNINVSHEAFYQAGPLPMLMNGYGIRNTAALERFLKAVRAQTTHLPEKRNKANIPIPRIKTILGLARKDDGHGLAHPPRVGKHGAGAKNVEFWLDDNGGSKGRGETKSKGQAASKMGSGSGKYITVFEFFKTSMCKLSIFPAND
jgi:eukaryotic translation initiation factor 2C